MADINSWPELVEKVRQGLVVKTNSAQVNPGEVFIAVPGTKVDGAKYIPDAIARGARCVVSSNNNMGESTPSTSFLYHPEPRKAVGELATAYFKTDQLALKVVGVTGTNGKTTVSFLTESLLASAGLKVGMLGTVQYRWPGFSLNASMTTPDCWQLHELLSNMEKSDVDVVVMEVSSHALDQDRTGGLGFDVALMTNLTQDHMDYHKDMSEYFKAKSKLFYDCPKKGKTGILNCDDEYSRRLLSSYSPSIGFGFTAPKEKKSSILKGTLVSSGRDGLHLRCEFKGRSWEMRSPLIGLHNGSNLLAAQAVGLSLGLSVGDLAKLSRFTGVPGRLQKVENDQGLDVYVDFAHTPDALSNVLGTLKGVGFRRIITVFGCGGNRDKTKRPLMARAVAGFSDVAILTSDNPRFEEPMDIIGDAMPGLADCPLALVEEDRAKAIAMGLDMMEPGDVLLIAGKGHEEYQDIKGVKRPYSDFQVARAVMEDSK